MAVFVNVIYAEASYALDRMLLIIITIYSVYTVQAARHQAADTARRLVFLIALLQLVVR